eukprot:14079619-Alexandrium_andersonii.AAC.1
MQNAAPGERHCIAAELGLIPQACQGCMKQHGRKPYAWQGDECRPQAWHRDGVQLQCCRHETK